jgi:hypothetical protein
MTHVGFQHNVAYSLRAYQSAKVGTEGEQRVVCTSARLQLECAIKVVQVDVQLVCETQPLELAQHHHVSQHGWVVAAVELARV